MGLKSNVVPAPIICNPLELATNASGAGYESGSQSVTPMRPTPLVGAWCDVPLAGWASSCCATAAAAAAVSSATTSLDAPAKPGSPQAELLAKVRSSFVDACPEAVAAAAAAVAKASMPPPSLLPRPLAPTASAAATVNKFTVTNCCASAAAATIAAATMSAACDATDSSSSQQPPAGSVSGSSDDDDGLAELYMTSPSESWMLVASNNAAAATGANTSTAGVLAALAAAEAQNNHAAMMQLQQQQPSEMSPRTLSLAMCTAPPSPSTMTGTSSLESTASNLNATAAAPPVQQRRAHYPYAPCVACDHEQAPPPQPVPPQFGFGERFLQQQQQQQAQQAAAMMPAAVSAPRVPNPAAYYLNHGPNATAAYVPPPGLLFGSSSAQQQPPFATAAAPSATSMAMLPAMLMGRLPTASLVPPPAHQLFPSAVAAPSTLSSTVATATAQQPLAPRPVQVSRFLPPPPPSEHTRATLLRNGSSFESYYAITMRWYARALTSLQTAHAASNIQLPPAAEEYVADFDGWVRELETWWVAVIAPRSGSRPPPKETTAAASPQANSNARRAQNRSNAAQRFHKRQ